MESVVAGDADDVVAGEGDQGGALVVVDVGEGVDGFVGEFFDGGEETHVDGAF